MEFTVEAVLAQAPDEASVKAARGLVVPGKWPTLGHDHAALWGECQGSGSKPYQTQVDLSGPSFKCSCPSRKFPCKHGLALLLLRVQHEDAFQSEGTAPAWVTEWLQSRQQRAAKQEQKKEEKPAQADPAAIAKRDASRNKRIAAGLDELERWLGDHVRHGLAQLPGREALSSEMAARMVDAQLPGMAARLRALESLVGSHPGWPAELLGQLGQLQLLIDAWRRLAQLPPAEQADVRAALGLAADKDEVLARGERVQDDWLVLGQSWAEEGKLWRRRVWLRGQASGRSALLLDFSHGGRRFEQSFMTGTVVRGGLAFYPGAAPWRALWVDVPVLGSRAAPPLCTLHQALEGLAQSLARHPWQWPLPLLVSDGVPVRTQEQWVLRTAAGVALPLKLTADDGWQLLALAGGQALPLMGEWDGQHLQPLSAWQPAAQKPESGAAAALAWMEGVPA